MHESFGRDRRVRPFLREVVVVARVSPVLERKARRPPAEGRRLAVDLRPAYGGDMKDEVNTE